MIKQTLIFLLVAAFVGGVAFAEQPSLAGYKNVNATPIPMTGAKTFATEVLFQGDMAADIGLGCYGGTGTSGGPNDIAVGVTATLTPPFGIIQATYNIFTGGAITAHSFVAWAGGGAPGTELGREAGFPDAVGNHTQALATPITISSGSFYIGFNQPQTNAGMRWGLDTTTTAGTSFIRAPTCGAAAFQTVDSLGFPGNWVIAATIDDTVPVELMHFGVE